MATINRTSTSETINKQKRELQNSIRAAQRECDHKNKTGPCLVSVHDEAFSGSGMYIKNRNKLPAGAVICKECQDVFDITAFLPEELEDAVMVLKSALNQIKTLANLNDKEYEEVVSLIEMFDNRVDGTLIPYYKGMIKYLSGEGKRHNRDNTNQKGRVGNIGGNMGVSTRSFR